MLNQRYTINKKKVVFLGYEEDDLKDKVFFDPLLWSQKNIDNTKIFFKKDTKVEINNKIKEIIIRPSDSKKIIFYKGKLRDWKISYIDKEKINNNSSKLDKELKSINGCLNFYDLVFENISINIQNSNVRMELIL